MHELELHEVFDSPSCTAPNSLGWEHWSSGVVHHLVIIYIAFRLKYLMQHLHGPLSRTTMSIYLYFLAQRLAYLALPNIRNIAQISTCR